MKQFDFFKTLLYDFDVENCNHAIEEVLFDNSLTTEKKFKRAFELIKLYKSQKVLAKLLYEESRNGLYMKLFIKNKNKFIENIIKFYAIICDYNDKNIENEVIKRKMKIYSKIDDQINYKEKALMKKFFLLMNDLTKEINSNSDLRKYKYEKLFHLSVSKIYDVEKNFYKKNTNTIKVLLNDIFLIRQEKILEYDFPNYTEFQLHQIGRTSFFQHDNSQLREDARIALHCTFKSVKNYYKCIFGKNSFNEYFQEIYVNSNFKKYYINSDEVVNVLKKMERLPGTIGEFAKILADEKLYYLQINKVEKDSFCFWIEKIKRPYICFSIYEGKIRISSIFHEFGHAYRLYSNRSHLEDLLPGFYGEIKEIFSIGMEFLCMQYFINGGTLNKEYKINFLCESLNYFPYAFAIEEFQDYVYSPNYNIHDVDEKWSFISQKYEVFDNKDKDSIWLKELGLVFAPYKLGNYVLAQIYIFYYFILNENNFSDCYISICEKEPMMILTDLKQLLKKGNKTLRVINEYFVKQLS